MARIATNLCPSPCLFVFLPDAKRLNMHDTTYLTVKHKVTSSRGRMVESRQRNEDKQTKQDSTRFRAGYSISGISVSCRMLH